MYQKCFKRLLDILLSLTGIIILFPTLIIIYIAVKVKLGSPILFVQKRPGKNEKIFDMYKFRTMTSETDSEGKLLPDEQRLTSFGKMLRTTSLDELPELFNILKGDMSIVGPRPQLVRDMVFMNEEQRKRHNVLPGLTGLAQANGRNDISWEKKFEYDIEYIQNITFWGDLTIIFKTVKSVFLKEGISTEGMATGEDFGDYLLRTNKIEKEEYNIKMREALELINKCR